MILRHTAIIMFLLYSVLSLICSGCAPKASNDMKNSMQEYPQAVYEKGDKKVPNGYYVHTVTLPGESLSIIAKWFTGDLRNWEKLTLYNPQINPNRIHLNDKIRIPRHMMTRQDPMTMQFVEESQPPQPRQSRPKAAIAPAKSVETDPKGRAIETKTNHSAPETQEKQPEKTIDEDEPFLFGPKDYSK